MNDALKTVFSLSLSGSLLILVLFFCKPFYKNRLSKRWQYYIWLVAVARLLLPFAPEQNLMGALFDRAGSATVAEADRELPENTAMPAAGEETGWAAAGESVTASGAQEQPVLYGSDTASGAIADTAPPSMADGFADSGISADILQYLWLVWLGAAAALLIQKVTMYRSFVKYIKAGRKEVSDIRLLDLLAETWENIGIKRPVELYVNEFVPSPLFLGLFRPCIVLPTADLPEEDLHYTIRHELIHYKRCDIFYKWLVQITVCLHWFNPFVWLMAKETGRACELACDEAVIGDLDEEGRKTYGDILLRAMRNGWICVEPAVSVSLSESAELLKERLDGILRFQKKPKVAAALSAGFAAVLLFGAVMAGAAAPAGTAKATAEESLRNTRSKTGLSEQEPNAYIAGESRMETLESDGTVYYLVFNEAQLRAIGTGEYGLDRDYMQQADIEMSKEEWVPIGTKDEPFTGSYNGNGYEIIGLTMADPDAELAGLFGAAKGAHLYNITMRNVDISSAGRNSPGMSAGAIVAYNMGPDGRSHDNRVYLSDEAVTVTDTPGTDSSKTFSRKKETAAQGSDSEEAASGAEKYYESGSIPGFKRAFDSLNENQQRAWLEKTYDDGEIAFFSVGLQQLNADSPLIENFAKKAYEEGKVGFFSVLTDNMKEDRLEFWLDRALEDGKINFQSVLFTALDRDEEMEALEEELDRRREEEYESVGITIDTIDRKNYYYQGQLINIFYDRQPNGGVYILNMNPAGTVNMKTVRDADGRVIRVEHMTEEEVAEMTVW